jgi:hypothetical protein
MKIYKLNYTDKETAIADLLAKGVYVQTDEGLTYGQGIHAIVEIGKVVNIQGTYDENGDIITEPIYYDGYAYDVMSDEEVDFGSFEIFPKNPAHGFSGL